METDITQEDIDAIEKRLFLIEKKLRHCLDLLAEIKNIKGITMKLGFELPNGVTLKDIEHIEPDHTFTIEKKKGEKYWIIQGQGIRENYTKDKYDCAEIWFKNLDGNIWRTYKFI